ncbi:MAG: type II/IV secretion system ATPase subunit [Candidatus Aenigmarchaeota archaeon]|nr:type II/IV secretion system ATPase subunit [Candidatus Aenigmarchaeota archaeon]
MVDLPGIRGLIRKKIEEAKKEAVYPKVMFREPLHIIALPSFRDPSRVDFSYPLIEPFATAHIKWDDSTKTLKYNVIEPEMSDEDGAMLKKMEDALTEVIDVKMSAIKNRSELVAYLQKKISQIMDDTGMRIPQDRYIRIMYYIIRDFVGLNRIEPLMHDPYIEDVGCTGTDTSIYIIHRKFGSMETNIIYKDFEELSDFVVKISERCGRYISYAKPLLDGSLPDGSRVQASLAKDVSTKGPTFSIRKFRSNPFSPVDMMNLGTASSAMLAYLWLLLQYDASMLIVGGVSTGKTSMLNVLSMFIHPEDKIISIEDTREINIPHANWAPSVTRVGFGVPESMTGKRYGEIDLFDLLRESFRQNPDYVIVGEVRGKEAYVMFQGMSSGHPSLGTMHAGSVDDVVKRLETPPIELSPSLLEALDIIIVMVNAQEKGKSARRVKEIDEIQSVDLRTGGVHTVKTFGWVPSQDKYNENTMASEVIRRISFDKGIPYPRLMEEIEKRKRVLEWMQRHNVVQYDEVCKIINLYYNDEPALMQWVEKDTPPHEEKVKGHVEKAWESVTGLRVVGEDGK